MINPLTFGKAGLHDAADSLFILTLKSPYFQYLPVILLVMNHRIEGRAMQGIMIATILAEDVLVAACV